MRRRDDRSAAPFIPVRLTLPALKRAAAACTGCDLHRQATQTVFGDGPPLAELLFVGEQPGDQEDRTGRPFVGPAGRVLDRALADAGIVRTQTYVTNAVKHFKWEPSASAESTRNLLPRSWPPADLGWKLKYRLSSHVRSYVLGRRPHKPSLARLSAYMK